LTDYVQEAYVDRAYASQATNQFQSKKNKVLNRTFRNEPLTEALMP